MNPLIKAINKAYRLLLLPYIKRYDINEEQAHEEYLEMRTIPAERLTPLTDDEKAQVVALWGIKPHSWHEYEAYKTCQGFDARFMPMSIYLPLISRRLNDYRYTKLFEHKSLLGYLVKGPIKFPTCCVRVVGGETYGDDMQQISRDEAIERCIACDRLVIKDSVDSSGGQGLEFVEWDGQNEAKRRATIEAAMLRRGTDYVIQQWLTEHETLRRFNPSSINTIRIQSLYLNGRCTAVTTVIRIGAEGAHVDNVCAGGVTVGIHPDGRLMKYGYDNTAQRTDRRGAFVFAETTIPEVPMLIERITECHRTMFPLCKYIGWDLMIDEQGEPVCIELNSSQNGQLGFQFSAGPTFGDRTQEVIDYCKTRPFNHGRALFRY